MLVGGWASCGCGTRVLPDGCLDVVWVHENLLVAGPATTPVLVPDWPDGQAFGVRLKVGAVEAALGVPADELRDLDVPLAALQGRRVSDRVARAARGGARAGLRVLVGEIVAMARSDRPDLLVREAARRLQDPLARMPEVARELGLGERQLRRRFERSVGYGWRTFARVDRLQRTLLLHARSPDAPLSQLAVAAGYADQPHMSREVRSLSGLTPQQLIASGARPAGERSGSFKTCGQAAHRLLR